MVPVSHREAATDGLGEVVLAESNEAQEAEDGDTLAEIIESKDEFDVAHL